MRLKSTFAGEYTHSPYARVTATGPVVTRGLVVSVHSYADCGRCVFDVCLDGALHDSSRWTDHFSFCRWLHVNVSLVFKNEIRLQMTDPSPCVHHRVVYASALAHLVDINPGNSSTAVSVNSLFRGVMAFVASQVALPIRVSFGQLPVPLCISSRLTTMAGIW